MSEPGTQSFSTNAHLYTLITNNDSNISASLPGYIDLRDIARAHVLAVESNSQSNGKPKRLAIGSPHNNNFKDTLKYIAEERPELKDRLIKPEKAPNQTGGSPLEGIEYERLERVIGFKKGEFRSWKETILDTVDGFVKLEESWKSRGFKL